jgi:hypothetical protein
MLVTCVGAKVGCGAAGTRERCSPPAGRDDHVGRLCLEARSRREYGVLTPDRDPTTRHT